MLPDIGGGARGFQDLVVGLKRKCSVGLMTWKCLPAATNPGHHRLSLIVEILVERVGYTVHDPVATSRAAICL